MLYEIFAKDSIYRFAAFAGSGLFVIQFLISLFGGIAEDCDNGVDGQFKFLSKQAITGFMMLFGWTGLTCLQEFNLSGLYTIWISCLSGFLTMFLTAVLFRSARKLHSSGTVFRIEDTIGLEAVVYQRILKGEVGKITVSVKQFTHEIDATAHEDLTSFTNVRITKKMNESTVLVVPTK
jgi:hypothetical protein